MSNNGSYSNGPIWLICGIIMFLALLSNLFSKNGPSSAPQSYEPDRSSFEYRYAKERFKQEGYSINEAAQAADAVLKFHRAQQARK